MQRNAEVFTNYAKQIDNVARNDIRVIVASQKGPVNFNCSVLAKHSKKLCKQNIVGISRTMEQRAKAILAERLSVNSGHIADVLVWGNTNKSHFIDTTNSRVHLYDGAVWGPPWYSRKILDMVHDETWIAGEYLSLVEGRRELVHAELKHPMGMSMAEAVVNCINYWWNGSPPGEMYSMTVCSQGKKLIYFITILYRHLFQPKQHF